MKLKNWAKLPWIEVLVIVLTLAFVAYVRAASDASEMQLTPTLPTPISTSQPWYMLGQYQPSSKPGG
ncbi:hypothetical protein [Motilimonas eburnea]|uniref:hypothetical protein n=1 Tax=Motilimonas eburnea TaxID=1737488 RepID=UPI001E63A014|nr:hypothetical protein [Motilimonas eburnea]MCE2572737.1 hypothetical protein [Motilimonas eburnea]